MADLNSPKVRIQWVVEAETKHGKFRDALYFSKAQFEALSPEQLKAQEDKRVNGYVAAVDVAKNAPPYEPTEAELIAEKERLTKEVAEIDAKIASGKGK